MISVSQVSRAMDKIPLEKNDSTGRTSSSIQEISSSEDSSYDSDCGGDGSEDCPNLHDDVSRTPSDTLAQEFSEYVNCSNSQINRSLPDSSYIAKVEFARKLGYSEDKVKRALKKLGPLATQNELLNELVQIEVEGGSCSSGFRNPAIRVNSAESQKSETKLRHVIIDGSNVAMSHGSNKVFSSNGISIAVDYFKNRGHSEITVFVPMYRKENNPDDPVTDPKILKDLEADGVLVWTPSKTINNRRMVCYDDRYILKLAADTDGVVVSNDNYRDLTNESPEYKKVIEERVLMYSFVNDRFMPPEDPLGRRGPTLEQFLQCNPTGRLVKKVPCPYGEKCTFGTKCKYYHARERVSVSDMLRQRVAVTNTKSLPILRHDQVVKQACMRTKSAFLDSASTTTAKLSLCPSPDVSGNKNQLKVRNSYGSPSTAYQTANTTSSVGGSLAPNNGHRKLQRQLSVNPNLVVRPEEAGRKVPEEPRAQLFQNLSAIFPADRVQHVMRLHPEENDAQVICRRILEIFK